MDISVGLAFLAGLASFLTPCVFSLVPAYIGYLSGRSIAASEGKIEQKWWETLSHGLAFVVGFSVVFILLGVAASALSGILYNARYWISKVGGIIVILFGLHMTGLLRISFLEYDLRPQSKIEKQSGYFSSFVLGVFFSFGWSPCIGPILGSILTALISSGMGAGEGVKLLSAYSVGLAIPFLAAAVAIGWVTNSLRKYGKFLHYVEIVMGVLLVIMGILLFLGTFEQLGRFGPFVNFGV